MSDPSIDRVAHRFMKARDRETASEAYDRLDAEINKLLARLPKLRVYHRRSFESGSSAYMNWGYPGELGRAKVQLEELLDTLGG